MATATPAPGGSVDFGRTFTLPTQDPDWVKKILIGGLFTLLCAVLVGVPFVLGYFSRTLRNVVSGIANPMPDWDDLGGLFNEGLRLTAVYLVYVLSVVVVFCALGCLLWLPFAAAGGHMERGGAEALGVLGGVGMVALYGLVMLVSLVLAVYLPAALARSAIRGTVADGFAWQAVVAFIRANLGNYLLSLVIYLVAGFVAQFGVLLCCVGVFPATFWAYMVLTMGLGETVRLNPSSI
jgi:hypothetical protein